MTKLLGDVGRSMYRAPRYCGTLGWHMGTVGLGVSSVASAWLDATLFMLQLFVFRYPIVEIASYTWPYMAIY